VKSRVRPIPDTLVGSRRGGGALPVALVQERCPDRERPLVAEVDVEKALAQTGVVE
jgi:hypothetical protein